MQGATMFVAALLLGFVGAACVFKLATNALVVAAGDRLGASIGGDSKRILTWPRDRVKIAVYSVATAILGAACFGLSYTLAARVFNGGY